MAPKAFGQEGRECGTTTALCRKTVAKQQEAKVNTLLPETQPQFEGIFVNSKAQTLEKPFPFFFFLVLDPGTFPSTAHPPSASTIAVCCWATHGCISPVRELFVLLGIGLKQGL